jgi:dTDP-4-dehydrorhamnose reductase
MTGPIKVLLAGAGGMLGQEVAGALGAPGPAPVEVTATTRAELDVTDLGAVHEAVAGHDVVVNCTAWTRVDDAETQEADAFTVNATAPGFLARACAASGAWLVHVSTDYVFAGDATTPYAEDAPIAPRSAYGRTKAAGEWAIRAELPQRHLILRTAWLYGRHGPNFVATMARLEGQRDTLDVVEDQRGQPTWARDLAFRIADVIQARPPAGTYHATSSGETTWFGLAREIFAALGADPERVRPTTSDQYVRPAPRPSYSVLGHQAWAQAGLEPLRDWREALAEAMKSGLVDQFPR